MPTTDLELRKPAVLVVDDERFMRELCADILSEAGFQVVVAGDAQAALGLGQADPPAVILLDMMLPGMGGIKALTHFARVFPSVPVIVITAHASLQTAIDAVKHGAYDYIPKPLESNALVTAVKRAADRHRLLTENDRLVQTLQDKVAELSRLHLLANELAKDLQQRMELRTAELHRSERLTESIINHLASGLMLADPGGVITLVNPQGLLTLNCRVEELLGCKLTDLFPNAGELLEVRGDSSHRELNLTLRDGTTIPIGFGNSYLTDDRGNREGVIVVFRDLSEIKLLQAELRRKDRLAAIGQVVAGVAHEVRNPLTAIKIDLQSVEERLPADSPLREPQERALREVTRLDETVANALTVARSGRVRTRPVDLRDAIRSAADAWRGDPETAAACVDRCLDALGYVDRNAHVVTLLECWLDELSAMAVTGRAVEL